MQNKELIKLLKDMPENAHVFFTDDCRNWEYKIEEVNYVESNQGNYIELVGYEYDM